MAAPSYVLPSYQRDVTGLNNAIGAAQSTYNTSKAGYNSVYNAGGPDLSGYYNTGYYSDGTDQYPGYQRWNKTQQAQMADFQNRMDSAQNQIGADKAGLSNASSRNSSVLSTFAPYLGDTFSQGLSQAYLTSAQPQLLKQYGDAQKSSRYALANQGNLTGSAQGGLSNQLQQLFQTNVKKLQDNATGYGQAGLSQARTAADRAYVASANGSDAPSVAANFASPFANYTKTNPIPALSDLFSGFLSGLSSGGSSFQANAGNGFGGTRVLTQGQKINAGSGTQKMVN